MNPLRYLFENAVIWFGKGFINGKITDWSNYMLHNQLEHFSFELPEVNKTADMQVNWRMTSDPKI